MTLENVMAEIISEAEKKRAEIIDQAKHESKKILEEATKKSEERKKHLDEATKKMLAETKRMELSTTNIRLHKMYLEAKKAVLDEIYNQLVEKINKLETSNRKGLLQKLVDKAKRELPDAKFIYCNGRDKTIVSGMKDMKFNGTINCLGGVIVENGDRTIRVNYTFDVLLQNVKEVYLNEVAKKVFEEE